MRTDAVAMVLSWVALIIPTRAQEPAARDPIAGSDVRIIDFGSDVRPILESRCVRCHGPDHRRGGLRLDSKAEALAGGDSGPAFIPGDGIDSEIVFRVSETDPTVAMPPEGEPLSDAERSILQAWIDQGALWPEEATEGSDRGVEPSHWAFRPATPPPLPDVRDAGWPRGPIDTFVLARLESEGVEPAEEADRRVLIRRLSIDLLGLLPSREEVDHFLADDSEDAYDRLVDRMLASPHFGERWARHWLDLARYADSDGYEKDSPRPFAYRYRDWVIDAFNADMPYDHFTIEQLAGDLLPDATLPQRTATGFHRNTLTNKEGGADPEEFRVAAVVDRVNTTGTVWLGLTVGCAQCHTHKYDPITQREYYGLFAFFNTSEEVDLPAPRAGEQEAFESAQVAFEVESQHLLDRLQAYDHESRPDRQVRWEAAVRKVGENEEAVPARIQTILKTPVEKRTRAQADELADFHRTVDPEYLNLRSAIEQHESSKPRPPGSIVATLAEPSGDRRTTRMLIRGDFLRPGDEVPPGTPRILPASSSTNPSKHADRLDLARWLVSPDHPLTSRVAVNRIWYQLFGRALVTTMDDFGTRGEPPSHPELLDWLAVEFQTKGWSQKSLIRQIVTSSTYRQSSMSRPELLDRDPNNVFVARQNRYRPEAEVVRDLFLGASGLISRRIGGPSARPPQPPGIAELTYAGSAKWVESQGEDRYRRGLYTWFQRTSPYPMLTTFDAPDANVCEVGRERSNTPLQALTLLNDQVFVEAARALGNRILRECPDGTTEERLSFAFEICLSRPPDDHEVVILLDLHDRTLRRFHAQPDDAQAALAGDPPTTHCAEVLATWVVLARTIMNLDEFVTRN